MIFFQPMKELHCIFFCWVSKASNWFIHFFLTVGGIFFLVPWSPTILWQISQKTMFKTPGPESKPNARPINEINEMFSSRIWWMKPAPMKLLFCIYLSPFSLLLPRVQVKFENSSPFKFLSPSSLNPTWSCRMHIWNWFLFIAVLCLIGKETNDNGF